MKRWLILVVLLFFIPVVAAASNQFAVSFHGIGGNQSISLDLVKYLNNPGPFKYSPVKNVNIVIENGIATITPKDFSWAGIEDIVFAPVGVEIIPPETEEQHEARVARRNITVSKEELDTSLGSMIDDSFYVIAGNLSGEQINISGFLSEKEISLEINDEVSLNISLLNERKSLNPEFIIDIHDRSKSLSLPDYREPSNFLFYVIVFLVVAAFVVVSAYFYTGYAQQIFRVVSVQEKRQSKSNVKAGIKRSYLSKVKSLQSRVGSDKPKVVLKDAMALLNEFFSVYFRISSPSKDKVIEKMSKKGVDTGKVESVYGNYASMAYGKVDISKGKVSSFISDVEAIIRQS